MSFINNETNKNKGTKLGEDGKLIDEFECPRDICYFAGNIYILDQVKNTIEIFTSSGEYLRSFHFNRDYFNGRQARKVVENPLSVRVNLNTMVIVDWKKSAVLFDLEFNLKGSIAQFDLMSVCLASDNLNVQSLKLFLHSQNGDFLAYKLFQEDEVESCLCFKPEMILKKNFAELTCSSEFMTYLFSSKAFILTLGWSKSIALIRF